VTYKRTKLDVENVHMLVYCKDNLSKVKISSRTYEDVEEEEAEDKLVLEEEANEVLMEKRTTIKNVGNGKKSKLSDTP
jgi:hypothetical protein